MDDAADESAFDVDALISEVEVAVESLEGAALSSLEAWTNLVQLLEYAEHDYLQREADVTQNERPTALIGDMSDIVVSHEVVYASIIDRLKSRDVEQFAMGLRLVLLLHCRVKPTDLSDVRVLLADRLAASKDATERARIAGVLAIAVKDRQTVDQFDKEALFRAALRRLRELLLPNDATTVDDVRSLSAPPPSSSGNKRSSAGSGGPHAKRHRASVVDKIPGTIRADAFTSPELAPLLDLATSLLVAHSECAQVAVEEDALTLAMNVARSARHSPLHHAKALLLLRALVAHHKPLVDFMQAGGFQLFFTVPRTPALAGALAQLGATLSALPAFMEALCERSLAGHYISALLWVLTDGALSARRAALSALSRAVFYGSARDAFEQQQGPRVLVNLIAICRPHMTARADPSAAQSTSVVFAVCQTMRDFLRAHVHAHLWPLWRSSRRRLRRPMSPTKAVVADADTMAENLLLVEEPFFADVIGRWRLADALLELEWPQLLVDLACKTNDYGEADSIARAALEALVPMSLSPSIHALLVQPTSSACSPSPRAPSPSPLTLLVETALGLSRARSAALLPLLQLLCALLCRSGGGRKSVSRAPPVNLSSSVNLSSQSRPPSSVADDAPVSAADAVLRATVEQFRQARGLQLLQGCVVAVQPRSVADSLRMLACWALCGLARFHALRQLFTRLPLYQLLMSDAARECVVESAATTHAEFRRRVAQLISMCGGPHLIVDMEDTAETKETALQRAAIVASTPIAFSEWEALQLIREYLDKTGHVDVAAYLAQSARLGAPLDPPAASPRASERPLAVEGALSAPSAPFARPTLDGIVAHYLRSMHSQCRRPLSLLPQMSLLAPHNCAAQSIDEVRGSNIAKRIFAKERGVPFGYFSPSEVPYERRLAHYAFSRFRPLRTDTFQLPSHTSLSFGADGDLVIAASGSVAAHSLSTGAVFRHDLLGIDSVLLSPRGTLAALSGGPVGTTYLFHRDAVFSDALFGAPNGSADGGAFSGLAVTGASPSFSADEAIAAVAVPSSSGLQFAQLWDVRAGGALCGTIGADGGPRNNYEGCSAAFSADARLVLFDGVLWDVRTGKRIIMFDRLTGLAQASQQFHPNGADILIDAAVWDMRTLKLARTCATLRHVAASFNSTGNVILTSPLPMYAFDTRHAVNPLQSNIQVIDAHTYQTVSTYTNEYPVGALALSHDDTHMAILQRPLRADRSVTRIFDIGVPRAVGGGGALEREQVIAASDFDDWMADGDAEEEDVDEDAEEDGEEEDSDAEYVGGEDDGDEEEEGDEEGSDAEADRFDDPEDDMAAMDSSDADSAAVTDEE